MFRVEPVRVAVAHDARHRQERLEPLAHRDGPAARPAAAVRLRERLVQVVVDDVEAHVAGARDPDDRVQVRAVVVEERACVVEDPRDVLDTLVEEAERRGVREHETGRSLVHLPAEIVEVEVAARVGLDPLELVAGHRHARGIRPVSRVRGDDRVALLAAVGEVRAHEHEPGQLPLRARGRLQRDRRKTRDLREHLLKTPHQLERALRAFVLLVRVEIAEPGKPGEPLVDARVVLHRAGAERVEAGVDAERPIGKRREVANELRLRDLGEPRRVGAPQRGRQLRDGKIRARGAAGAASRARALEDERRVGPGASRLGRHRHTSSSTFASRSMSSAVRFSVSATSRTSSIPS